MIYLDESYVTISWDEDIKAVILEWKGFVSFDKIKLGLEAGLKIFQERKTTRWMADMTKLGAFGKEAQDWSTSVWLPQMVQAGLKNVAFVMPQSAMTRLALTANVEGNRPNVVEIKFFDNRTAAREWLQAS